MRHLTAFFLSLALSSPAFALNTVKTPTTYAAGSSLTIQTGVVVTFAPGSIVNFTGATVTGLPSATGATIPVTTAIIKGDGAGNGAAASASDINGVINSTVAPIFSNISARPTTYGAGGYGITDVQPLDADLTAISALTGTNVLYYRNADGVWLPVTIGANMTFTSGTLASTGGGGGGGDASTNTATSVDSEVVLFSGTAGKTLKRSTITGLDKLTAGVQSAAVAGTDYVAPTGTLALGSFTGVTGSLAIANGGTGRTALGTGLQVLRTNAGATATEWAATGDATIAGSLAQFAATTSAQLAGVLTNETGTGLSVFNSSPTLITPNLGVPSSIILTNGTGLLLTTGVTGILPVTNIPTGTGSTQVALGNDTRFPASVIGIRKSAGAGSTDLPAVPDVDFVKDSSATISGGTTGTPVAWPLGKLEAVETSALAVTAYATLPAASSLAPGTSRRYVDSKTTGSFGRVFRRAGSDTINGASADVAPFIAGAGGIFGNKTAWFVTDGISNWTLIGPGSVDRVSSPTDATKSFIFSAANQGTAQGVVTAGTGNTVTVAPGLSGDSRFMDGVNGDGSLHYRNVIPTDLVPNEVIVGDVDAVVSSSGAIDSVKLGTVLTALRFFTFPPASAYLPGETVRFYSSVDSAGNIARVNSAVSDTFNGQTSIDLSNPYFNRSFVSDGMSNWTVNLPGVAAQPFKTITPSGTTFTLVSDANSIKQNGTLVLNAGANTLYVANPFDGMQVELLLMQNGTGGGTLTLPVGSRTASGGGGLVTLTSAANSIDRLKGIYYSSSGGFFLWDPVILNETSAALPAAPTSLGLTGVSASEVDLAWTDNATTESGYLVERAPGLTATTGFVQFPTTLAPNTVTYKDFSTVALTPYTYRVRAQNTGGYSGYSNAPSLTTGSGAPNADLLEWHLNEGSGITGTATAGPNGTLSYASWTSSTQNGSDPFAFNELIGMLPTNVTLTTVGTAGTTTYQYKVAAWKTDGTHNNAGTTSSSILTGNAVLDGTNYNHISWVPIAGADYYEVYRISGGGLAPGKLAGSGSTLTGTFLDDKSLASVGSTPSGISTATNVYQVAANSTVTYNSQVLTVSFWVNSAWTALTTDVINGGANAWRIQSVFGASTPRLSVTMPGTGSPSTGLAGYINMTGFTSTWHNVVVVMDQTVTPGPGVAPTGLLTIYVDGVSKTITYTNSTHTGSPIFAAGTPLIGSVQFAGGIDDVRIYGHGLSGAEVLAIYNGNAQ